jgi:hypothetical protein
MLPAGLLDVIRSHFGERTVEIPLRYALAVNPPAHVPSSLNGFALWNTILLVLMLVAYRTIRLPQTPFGSCLRHE